MKALPALIWICSITTITIACNSGNNETGQSLQTKEVELDKMEDYTHADTTTQLVPPAPTTSLGATQKEGSVIQPDWEKKIVKTATLQAEVKDFGIYTKALSQKVKALGGYISSEQQAHSEYRIENTVIIKVPVALFGPAVESLLKDVQQVDTRQISSEDVSAEYIDSKSRLEAKKQVRQRYLELLKSARSMSDIIEVQKEINGIQEEIELVTGRMNYLGNASAMSTIHLTYYQVLNASASNKDVPGYLAQLKDSFANGWYWLGELLLGLVTIWPLVLSIGLVVFLLRKKTLLRSR